MPRKVVDPRYAKSKGYREAIAKIKARLKCPFCQENLGGFHKHPILREKSGWRLTRNTWPYENAKHHFLIIPRRHFETLGGLTVSDLKAVYRLAIWASRQFNIKGGAMPVRFGVTEYTGATICHLHYHLIQPKMGKAVQFPVG